MAEVATLARPYANAVFDIAKNSSDLDRWSRMLGCLSAVAADDSVRQLLDAPEMPDEQKAFRLADICGDELDDRARKMIQVLARNKRLGLIGEIRDQFEELKAQDEKVLDVEVVSARPLSAEQEERLRSALAERYQREVTMSSRVDEHLLGGAVIRAGDTVIDGSVRGKLNKLAETLQRT
jgi:F-type H+-transporting ATPase subunit delta